MTDKKSNKQPRPPDVESFTTEATTQEGVTKTTRLYRPTNEACERFDISYAAPPIFGSAIEVRAFLTERRTEIKAEKDVEKRRIKLCEELAKLGNAAYEIANSGPPMATLCQRHERLGARLSGIRDAIIAAQMAIGCDILSCEPVEPPGGDA